MHGRSIAIVSSEIQEMKWQQEIPKFTDHELLFMHLADLTTFQIEIYLYIKYMLQNKAPALTGFMLAAFCSLPPSMH